MQQIVPIALFLAQQKGNAPQGATSKHEDERTESNAIKELQPDSSPFTGDPGAAQAGDKEEAAQLEENEDQADDESESDTQEIGPANDTDAARDEIADMNTVKAAQYANSADGNAAVDAPGESQVGASTAHPLSGDDPAGQEHPEEESTTAAISSGQQDSLSDAQAGNQRGAQEEAVAAESESSEHNGDAGALIQAGEEASSIDADHIIRADSVEAAETGLSVPNLTEETLS